MHQKVALMGKELKTYYNYKERISTIKSATISANVN